MVLSELKWRTLTTAINEIDMPSDFFSRLLKPRAETLTTEIATLSGWSRSRKTAPFVKKNAEALLLDGPTRYEHEVSCPNIRVKTEVTPPEFMDTRMPGTQVFAGENAIAQARREYVRMQLMEHEYRIRETEEWMISQLIDADTISYSVDEEGGDAFTITLPNDSSLTYTASKLWDAASDPQDPSVDFKKAKQLMVNDCGLSPTDAVMGETAADAFMAHVSVLGNLDRQNFDAGRLTIEETFNDSGAIYLGRYAGIRCWQYGRSTTHNGSSTALINTNKVHFLHAGPSAQWRIYYGAIPDWKALGGYKFKGRRFTKSWEQEDPSVMTFLTHSRPLPWMRRYGAKVTATVAGT